MGKQVHKKKQHKRPNPLGGTVVPNGMADIVPKEEEILPIIQKVSIHPALLSPPVLILKLTLSR
jgi:hypothetical protein